jgi:hypothetical protein
MWMLWFLITLVGLCLVLSMFDAPPARVPVRQRFRAGTGDPGGRMNDADADCREISERGRPR